jgi:murein DD-endopeptidase MepM/ murein hydrolase activator NlpD
LRNGEKTDPTKTISILGMKKHIFIFLLMGLLIFASNALFATPFAGVAAALEFSKETIDNQVYLYCKNNTPATYTLRLSIETVGMKSSVPDKSVVRIEPNANKQLLAVIKPIEGSKTRSYHTDYTYSVGDATAKHDDGYVYALPFKKGQQYKVGQGYLGTRTHHGQNALDFSMPEGTDVCAMREGRVVQIKEDSNEHCPSPKCAEKGNFVLIEQPDGTLAEYFHLAKNGALVEVGQQVAKGQVIGKSGNTGYTNGPHLHIKVYVARFGGEVPVGIKTTFATAKGPSKLIAQQIYKN